MNDKLLHISAGFIIAAVIGAFVSPVAGFVIASLAGASKEAYDKFHLGHMADWYDLLATVAGGIVGALLVLWLL